MPAGVIRERSLIMNKYLLKVLTIMLTVASFFTGCASIQPMSDEAVGKYALNSNPGNFKKFQYYVSRDIVLTYVASEAQTNTPVGQVRIHRDIVQILSSTPGVVIDVRENENGYTMLGVAFESSDDNLLWFIQSPNKPGTYFYLAYTNAARRVISYGGNPYTVSYEQATGIGANMKRMNPFSKFSKVKKTGFENMEPILLYEEMVKESEKRRNVQGRKL